jgi:hypothetical protein
METPLRLRQAVESEIRTAFRGVILGQGTSLRRTACEDEVQSARRNADSASAADAEIADDWSRLPLDDLETDFIAHLDALGFRYYIPALMLSVLEHYESSSMRVTGTLLGLYPKKGDRWEYHMHRYSALNPAQKTSIARFLEALPKLVELDLEGQRVVSRALRNYWGDLLHTSPSE